MTEPVMNVAAAMQDRDVDLVMDFVVGELNQAGVEQLRRRIERDPAFRRLAENIIAAYQIPLIADEATDRAELERAWDEFTKSVGFTHQRRRLRNRRLGYGITIVVALLLAAAAGRDRLRDAWWLRGFEPVPRDSMTLADGSRIQLDSGARLEVHERFVRDTARFIRLAGAARIVVAPSETQPRFYVLTPAGIVHTSGAEFSVRATRESTTVTGGAPGARFGDASSQTAAPVYLTARAGARNDAQVFPGQRAAVGLAGPVVKDDAVPQQVDVVPRRAASREGRIASLRDLSVNPARALPGEGEIMRFPAGVVARVDADARIGMVRVAVPPERAIELDGAALFLVPTDTAAAFTRPTYVKTAAGYVAVAPPLALSVVTRGDTTDVRVFSIVVSSVGPRNPWVGGGLAELYLPDLSVPKPRVQLLPGQGGRMVVGRSPEKLP